MGWAKFDDRWPTHPKLLAAGLEAKGLDASGICYSAGQETDGFIPDSALSIIAAGHRNPRKVANVLVSVGRWSRDDERKGYVIHDYLEYNPTRQAREADRVEKRRAGKLGGQRSGETRRKPKDEPEANQSASSEANQSASLLLQPGANRLVELPARPDPSVDKSSSNHEPVEQPTSEEEELHDKCSTAARLVAERRLAVRTGPPLTNATNWLRSVRAEVLRDNLTELWAMASTGVHPKAMADRIQPAVTSPYPAAGEPYEPAWSENDVVVDEQGNLVVRTA